jgi:hypothetical protein
MDLIESREDGEDIASRILKKKGVATLSELSLDDIQKAIEWLTNG